MPGRKRANPRRVDADSPAKKRELFQFVPSSRMLTTAACADSACLPHDCATVVQPLAEISNTANDAGEAHNPGNVKPSGEKKSDETPGVTREPFSISVPHLSLPLLHGKMLHNDIARISGARANLTSDLPAPVMFARLSLELKSPCPDLEQLLGPRCTSATRISLISLYHPFTNEIASDYLKIEDGENVTHLEVTVDYRLESSEARKALRALFKTSTRGIVTYECPNDGADPVISLELWALEKLCEFQNPSEVAKKSSLSTHCNNLVEALYPEMVAAQQESLMPEAPPSSSSRHLTIVGQIENFYKDVQQKRRESAPSSEITMLDLSAVPGLTAELRGYQRQGVQWMLEKERKLEGEEEWGRRPRPLHMLWKELPTIEHGLPYVVYFNIHSGKFTTKLFPEPHWPRGGILADEMGLGKTVEVLALVMTHKWPGAHPQEPMTNQKAATADKNIETTNQIEDMDTATNAVDPKVGVAQKPEAVGKDDALAVAVASEEVQCLCGAMREDQFGREFVQCERCLVWQHSACVGFDSTKDSSFVCVRCLLKKPMPCGTTLIVSPQSIAQQWMEEIEKHTEPGSLKVMLYEGVKRATGYVSPAELASCDIVLVTYETLRTEFYHATSQEVSWNLRHRKRYVCYPSPLPAVHWWRVCLDEAQMVESTHAKAAEMMMKVTAVNKWCVTGTPVQRCLLDLYGLVLFLGVEPYSLLPWYNRLVWNPFLEGRESVMISLFSKIMWRSSKADVAKELGLPEQTEELHWLSFSSVERYFYRRQQENCSKDLKRVVSGLPQDTATLSSLLNSTVTKLMHPLHSLRQACCHPSIVRGSYLPVNISNRNCMSMPALLKKLTQHTKGQTRDALRMQVSAYNGLAGLHILNEDCDTAVEMYCAAMKVWQDHESHDVECDRVQRIHTMENLAKLLADGYGDDEDIGSLEEDTLLPKAMELRSEFIKRSRGQVMAAEEAYVVCKKNVKEAQYEADKNQAKFLGELPDGVEENEDTNQQPSLSCQNKDGAEASSNGDQARPEDKLESEEGAKEKSTSESDAADESGHPATHQDQPESGNSTSNKDTDGQEIDMPESKDGDREKNSASNKEDEGKEDEAVCEEGDRVKSTSGNDASDTAECPLTTEDKPESDQPDKTDDNDGASAKVTTPEQGKEKERPVINPSQCWWLSVTHWAEQNKLVTYLVEHVNNEFSTSDDPYRTAKVKFKEVEGISFKLFMDMDQLKLSRELVLSGLEALLEPPTPEFIAHVGVCHIHRHSEEDMDLDEIPDEECDLCIVEKKTISYERQLFSRYQAAEDGLIRSQHGDGSRGMSDLEHIIKAMVSFVRYKGAPRQLLKSGQALLSYLDTLKKEYRSVRKLWLALHEHFSDCDELRQAANRIRFMTPIEILLDFDDVPFAVHPCMVDLHILQCQSDLHEAKSNLRKYLGQLVYLQNLAKTPEQQGENTDPCLICTGKLGREWGVFTCGHPFCIDCIVTMVQHNPASYCGRVSVKCPLCREPTLSTEINYIKSTLEDELNCDVKGSHSAKVIAIVKTLMGIQKNNPGAKALVFSTWKEILDLIGRALSDNNIDFRVLVSDNKRFQANLSEFKTSKDVNVLLLPFHSGSKGLNIIEATHVLLVEPLLNVSAEQQAIGRVHRMGQKKPTFVHRFYIENTVEEKLHHLHTNKPERAEFLINNECDSVLTVGDIRSLVEQ